MFLQRAQATVFFQLSLWP